jgi:methylated-DNA-[protein]-cysteine S-methyltransferase
VTGELQIAANARGVTQLSLRRGAGLGSRSEITKSSNDARARAERELRDYFAGRIMSFSVACDTSELSPFTQKVLSAAAKIPYGQVRSYKWLAERLGKPKAARAVGNALARNPVPILIPYSVPSRGARRRQYRPFRARFGVEKKIVGIGKKICKNRSFVKQ